MHWSQHRALNTIARHGHAILDAEFVDAVSRDQRGMTDDVIAATLRKAVKHGIAIGWYRPKPGQWVVNTEINGAKVYDQTAITLYCFMLQKAGCTP